METEWKSEETRGHPAAVVAELKELAVDAARCARLLARISPILRSDGATPIWNSRTRDLRVRVECPETIDAIAAALRVKLDMNWTGQSACHKQGSVRFGTVLLVFTVKVKRKVGFDDCSVKRFSRSGMRESWLMFGEVKLWRHNSFNSALRGRALKRRMWDDMLEHFACKGPHCFYEFVL